MAHFYANENFPLPAVLMLRQLEHDVLTSTDAGKSNQSISDEDVLQYAIQQQRAILTINRKHFVRLHRISDAHYGVIVCSLDPDFAALAVRIDQNVNENMPLNCKLLRINRSE